MSAPHGRGDHAGEFVFSGADREIEIQSLYQWRGGRRLGGDQLLVLFGGGYGDSLQCSRFIPPFLAWADGPVAFVLPPQLERLFGASFPAADIRVRYPLPPARWIATAWGRCWEESWEQICHYRLRLEASPAPYLRACQVRAFAPGALHVGLTWTGDQAKPWNRYRAIADPTLLTPLWDVPGVCWHSLAARDGPSSPHPVVEDHRAELCSWEDTANFVAGLDLVLSVDTAVAHLAGALDVPLWILLRPDWPIGVPTLDIVWNDPLVLELGDPRWSGLRYALVPGDRVRPPRPGALPLYRSATLFLQPTVGDWASVMARVAGELDQLVGAHT